MNKKKEIIPFEATHPGTLIKDELDARGIKQNDFAMEIGVKPNFLNEVIKGKRSVTADFALLLEKSLEIPADYWMRFQSQYEIDNARLKQKNIKRLKHIETWNIIKEYVPIKFLKKLGYLTTETAENIEKVKEIYSIKSIDGLVNVVAENKELSFYRKSQKLQIDDVNMLGWSKVAEHEVLKKEICAFDENQIPQLLEDLKSIFFSNRNVKEKAKTKLESFGVKLLYLDKFEKTPVDGYSFWSGNNPAIVLTLRHKRIDNFAFTIFHEIAHIKLHILKNKESKFIDIIGYESKDLCEDEANKFAQDQLISPEQWQDLLNNYRPINDDNIISFSKKYKINPAIVLGRINWEKDFYKIRSGIDKALH
jgi:HTH-type transcriptional regulator / antitoxin HigA